jgi:2-oxoglutarate dehydrogenase complex dehydrogenase (E1) component-like enzyme
VVSQFDSIKSAGITKEMLKQIGSRITSVPPEFEMHPQIRKIYDARK